MQTIGNVWLWGGFAAVVGSDRAAPDTTGFFN